jgi:hypothetical protein
MKAVVWSDVRDIELQEVPDPRIERPRALLDTETEAGHAG